MGKPKKPKPKAPKPNRLEMILRGRELIGEYIDSRFEDLLKLRSGSLAIQTICQDLGIIDNNTMIDIVNSVWLERAGTELARAKAKTQVHAAIKNAVAPSDHSLDTKYQDQLVDLVRQLEEEAKANVQVFGEALQHALDQLAALPPAPPPTPLRRGLLTLGRFFDKIRAWVR